MEAEEISSTDALRQSRESLDKTTALADDTMQKVHVLSDLRVKNGWSERVSENFRERHSAA